MADEAPIFSPSLLPDSIRSNVPDSYIIRPMARNDYQKGYFECLNALTWTGDVTEAQFRKQFDWMASKGDGWFYNVVIEHEGRIVGNGVLIAERKFIWGLGMVGHLEEISVLKAYQGKGFGRRIIEALTAVAKNVGCSKVILNCSPENEHFYEKCGYKASGKEMSIEFQSGAKEQQEK
ncbi:Glucosamine-phosphate N-acetyltransferase-like protein [Saxophila tyrrhenica]|uniref:Glucosamine 6-phosphate N-acetyltransferase n=1 Tax=Saxophila tyrrhenica TaxID=1690608 RepID=A0AAV9PC89_9PEZI|nr:Glucosamine-phosphate N-acetyltransferase-like protein [Saxophila tyrrhenica]